ncbi:MAG: hypothetical protein ACK5LY_03525 [Lachnospirales bacterium]
MGLLSDLVNLEGCKLLVKDIAILNKRGVYPMYNSGKLVGFTDDKGIILIKYKS